MLNVTERWILIKRFEMILVNKTLHIWFRNIIELELQISVSSDVFKNWVYCDKVSVEVSVTF